MARVENDTNYIKLVKESDKLNQEIIKYNSLLEASKQKIQELGQGISKTANSQNKLANFFSSFKDKLKQANISAKGFKNAFSSMPKVSQNLNGNFKKIGNSLKLNLKSLLKYVAALFSLRTIYSTLTSAAQSWLSSQNKEAQQASANIEYMKYAMGSALSPIIIYVTNLVVKLMQAVQSLVYALSGVNIFAKATAQSMKSVANSSKSLAGVHNEINNVGDSKGSSSNPSIDLSQIDSSSNTLIEKIKSKLTDLFQPIKKSWDNYGQPLIQSISSSFNNIKILISNIASSFGAVWENGTGEQTLNIILQILTSIFGIIGNISVAFYNAWNSNGTQIIQNLWNSFNNLLSIIKNVYTVYEEWTSSESFQNFANAIISICNTLSSWFQIITLKLKEIWDNGGKETFTKLLDFVSKLAVAIDEIFKFLTPVIEYVLSIVVPVIEGIIKYIGYLIDYFSGMLDFITGIFQGDWEKAWSGIKKMFESVWNMMKTILQTVINFFKLVIENGLNMCLQVWSKIWNMIKTIAVTIWNGVKETISNVITNIKNGISNALDTISNIWSNVWNGIKDVVSNVWNGIWEIIKGVINTILWGIECFINGAISLINIFLGGLSGLGSAIGSLVGLGPINLRLSKISLPRLAKGNVAYSETMAVFGEYSGASHNPEITTPQNIMRDTFKNVLSEYGTSSNGQPIRVQIYWGTKNVVDEIIDGINEKSKQTGKAQIKVSYA